MKNQSDITVITASYNSKRYLWNTVESVINQSLLPLEHIIIDDCSNDGSYDLAKQYEAKYPHIRVVRHENNSGFPAALNTGIRESKTPFIAILDSDDIAMPNWLQVERDLMSDESIGAVGCAGIKIAASGAVTGGLHYGDTDEGRVCNGQNPFSHPGTLWRKSILERYGLYDTSMHGWEDTEIFTRVAPYTRLVHCNHPLIYYRLSASSLSFKVRALWPKLRDCLTKRYQLQINGVTLEEANDEVAPLFKELRELRNNLDKSGIPGRYEQELAKSYQEGNKPIRANFYFLISALKRRSAERQSNIAPSNK